MSEREFLMELVEVGLPIEYLLSKNTYDPVRQKVLSQFKFICWNNIRQGVAVTVGRAVKTQVLTQLIFQAKWGFREHNRR
jgi:hypothetical protein